MVERNVGFYSGPGLKLSARLYVSDEPSEGHRRAGIVFCHGFRGFKEYLLPPIAEEFRRAGYVVLAFDYRGFGGSEGSRYRLIPLEQVEDIFHAVSYMSTLDEVDPGKIGLWGTSFGGGTAVYAAARDKRVRAVVSVIGVGNGERWLKNLRTESEWKELLRRVELDRKRKVASGESESVDPLVIMPLSPEDKKFFSAKLADQYPEFKTMRMPLEVVDAVLGFRPEEVVDKVSPAPVLFISAERDRLVPTIEQRSMYRRARKPKRFVTVAGAGHYDVYHPPHLGTVLRHSLEWFGRYLQS